LGTLREIGLLDHEGFVAFLLFGVEGTAEGFQSELSDKAGAAGRRGFTGDETARIASTEGVAGEFFGGGAVGFDEERREVLGLGLITESVDEVFWRELIGRHGLISEEITNGVVVLAVGKAAEVGAGRGLCRVGSFFFAVLEGGGEFDAFEFGEFLNPGFEDGFVGAVGLDAFATGVFEAIGGLDEEEGVSGVSCDR
jgi:hypothetical protein